MKNYVSEGKTIKHKLDAAKSAGQGTLVGQLFGVCVSDGAIGDEIALMVEGVYDMPAGSGDTYAVGAVVGYDEAGDVATAAGLGDKNVGVCVEAKIAGTTSVRVKLVPTLA